MKLEFSQQIVKKYSNIKFHENLPGNSRVVPCRQTDMMKLRVALYDFANAPKKSVLSYRCTFHSIQIMLTPAMNLM
jgi:hypothetical protein